MDSYFFQLQYDTLKNIDIRYKFQYHWEKWHLYHHTDQLLLFFDNLGHFVVIASTAQGGKRFTKKDK